MPINISTSPAVFRWKPACWLRVTGEDARNFLQGQFTNDLRMLGQAPAVYGLWLSLKGKVVADGFVIRGKGEGELWIGSYFSPARIIRERLESHVIADDVLLEDRTADWSGLTVLGATSPGRPPFSTMPEALSFAGRRDRSTTVEWLFPVSESERDQLIAPATAVVDDDEMARRRIAAGIPAIPSEIGPADLPNEAGLEEAISYTKGCYLGQEVMARLKSMGQVRRRLWRVRGVGNDCPVPPVPVFAGTRQVGELRAAVREVADGWIGLALVTSMHVSAGIELSFSADGATALRLNDVP